MASAMSTLKVNTYLAGVSLRAPTARAQARRQPFRCDPFRLSWQHGMQGMLQSCCCSNGILQCASPHLRYAGQLGPW